MYRVFPDSLRHKGVCESGNRRYIHYLEYLFIKIEQTQYE